MSEAITISNETSQESSKNYTYEDLQAVIKRGGKGLPITKLYEPKTFWESMGDKFFKAFDQPGKCGFGVEYFVDRLKEFKPSSILDVGCGFGRVGPFLLQAKVAETYTGLDIAESIMKCSEIYLDPTVKEDADAKSLESFFSNGQLSEDARRLIQSDVTKMVDTLKTKANEKASKTKPDFRSQISVVLGDVRKMQFESEAFDCVISNECVQHLNPHDAKDACQEMARVSKGPIVMLERWAFPGEHSEPHVWSHNYCEIFTSLGLEVLQVTTISAGLQGVVVRKR